MQKDVKSYNAASKADPGLRRADPDVIVLDASLETVCGVKSKFPEHAIPEVAFAGKSNVGKSSLINALLQRKALARTSATPGKTQTINFYHAKLRMRDALQEKASESTQDSLFGEPQEYTPRDLQDTSVGNPPENPSGSGQGKGGDRELYLVDLPGYGYTKASETVRASWGKMVERYLHQTKVLQAVFLLVDMRHKPTADDCLMHEWILSQGYTPVIVATKADKLKKNERTKALKLIWETLSLSQEDTLIPFSAETKEGRAALYRILMNDTTA